MQKFWRVSPFFAFALFGCAFAKGGWQKDATFTPSAPYAAYRSINRTVYIQNFENRTLAPHLTGILNEKIQTNLTRLRTLTVTDKKDAADLILYGKILLYLEEPGVFDRSNTPLTYNLTAAASFRLQTRERTEKTVDLYEDHEATYSTTYSAGEPLFESRSMAEERLMEGLAERIVNSLYEPRETR